MADGSLTEEQKRRIEENRQKAIALRKQRENASNSPKITTPKPTLKQNGSRGNGPFHQKPAAVADKVFPSRPIVKGTCTLVTRKRFAADMPYDEKVIQVFKTIPSRVYDAATKRWNFALEDHSKLVAAMGPLRETAVIGSLPSWVTSTFKTATATVEVPDANLSRVGETLDRALLPFQREGVRFGIRKEGKVLIADDMGLGKTIQAIAIAAYYRCEWPLLVVCPSSVRYTWAEELEQWLPSVGREEVVIVDTSKTEVEGATVVITSYDLMTRKKAELRDCNFRVVILDECHALKSPKSARTKAAQFVTQNSTRVILLSGTPALSRPSELFTQICLVNKGLIPGLVPFGIRYCAGHKSRFGWDFSGSSNMVELQLLLEETVMIRRMKSVVIAQLPAKRRQVVLLDPAQVCTTGKGMKDAASQMQRESLKGLEKRGALLQYFHETGAAKLPAIREYIKDLLDSGKKFLCFAHHRAVVEGICATLESEGCGFVCIDGATRPELRKEHCDRFQFDDKVRVAVLSITAASTGLTLTAAALVVFAELYWNPGILTQAEDRAHRIGQEDCVIVQYLVAKGTSDDYVWPLVQKKLDVLNQAGLSKDNFKDAASTSFHLTDSQSPKKGTGLNPSQCSDTDFLDELLRAAEEDPAPTARKRMKVAL